MRFADYGNRVMFAAFDGGEITSEAGVLLLREQARRIGLRTHGGLFYRSPGSRMSPAQARCRLRTNLDNTPCRSSKEPVSTTPRLFSIDVSLLRTRTNSPPV